MHNHGGHFHNEPREVSPANKYKAIDGLCHWRRACHNSLGVQLLAWITRACTGLHFVSTKQSKELEERRNNMHFHLMGEVDLEEYEFPLVDSGLGPRLSSLL